MTDWPPLANDSRSQRTVLLLPDVPDPCFVHAVPAPLFYFAEIAGHSQICNRLFGPTKKMALKSATTKDQSSGAC
jgi:hypothetical protein